MNEILSKNLEALKKQLNWLEHSFQKCKSIKITSSVSIEDLDSLETLSSRFARSIDFLIRKVWRAIDEYEFENQGTLIDVVNNAHKRNLIESVEEIRVLKNLRNDIAHEYINENLFNLYEDLINYTPKLIEIIKTTVNFLERIK